MFDSHIHLDQYPPEKLERLIEQWKKEGVTGVLAVSTDLASCYQTLELRGRFPGFVHAALGYHPEQKLPPSVEQEEIFSLIRQERHRISAIGEVGLPYYTREPDNPCLLPAYTDLLRNFCRLAVELDLPMSLHAVHEQAAMALQVLEEEMVPRAQFHWLKADSKTVAAILAAGHFISVTPEICYRQRDQELCRAVGNHQLLLETDGPWPFEGIFTGQLTTPLFLKQSLSQVAIIKEQDKKTTEEQCDKNSLTFLA